VIIKITGQVQGVGFRWSAKRKADELQVFGTARNEPNGEVFIEAEGGSEAVDGFIEWCRCGPDYAMVNRVEVSDSKLKNYGDFEIVV